MSNIYRAKGETLEEQYRDVGVVNRTILQQTKLSNQTKVSIAKKVLSRVRSEPIFTKFYKCFGAWASGAQIDELRAMYLLVDNLEGCQTLMVRYNNGVGMIHTEEDFNDPFVRIAGAHTIEFCDNDRKLWTLCYNNLMPGCALYGWQKDMLVAVDALFLSEKGIDKTERPMLVNILGWLIWEMEVSQADADNVILVTKLLGEFVDGYAFNIVRRVGEQIGGYKICVARKDWKIEKLGNDVGAKIYQVNTFDVKWEKEKARIVRWQAPHKEIDDYDAFAQRQAFLNEFASEIVSKLNLGSKLAHTEIQQLFFGKYREQFVNEWMGAGVVGMMNQSGDISVSTKLNDNEPLEKLEYVIGL